MQHPLYSVLQFLSAKIIISNQTAKGKFQKHFLVQVPHFVDPRRDAHAYLLLEGQAEGAVAAPRGEGSDV